MSNAMRSGKRMLAGVAAGALTAGLIPFAVVATATSAQAATTLSVDQSIARAGVTVDDTTATINNSEAAAPAMRVYVQPSADITGLNTGAGKVNVRIDSKPAGAGVALGTVYQSDAIAGTTLADDSIVTVDLVSTVDNATTLADFSAAGNYGVTVWVSPTGASTVGAGNVTFLGNVVVAGAPTSIAFAKAAQSGPADVADTNAVALADASGRLTRLGTGETVPLSTAQTTGTDDTLYIDTTNPTSATTLNFGVADATAAVVSTGATFGYAIKASAGSAGAFTTTAAGAGIGIAANPTSVFTVQPQTTTKSINVAAPNLASSWAGPVTASATTSVRTDTTTLEYTVTADDTAVAGELVPLTVTTITNLDSVKVDGETVTNGKVLYKAINSSRQAKFSVVVTGNANNSSLVVTTGGAINAALTVDWDPAAFTLATNPASGANLVLAPGAAASIQATVADQFGNGYLGACVVSSNGTASSTTTTPASGVVTVSIPAPATGTSASLTVDAFQQGCSTQIGSTSTVTATYGVAVITLTGVSTESVDETVAVPSQVSGDNDFRQVTANVKVNGSNVPNNTVVAFTGSESVRFGGAATGTWADSVDETTVVTSGGNGNASVYMTSSKAGKATVTASAAGQSASGEVTGTVVAGTQRVVGVSAPALSASGDTVPVTVSVTDGFGNAISGITVTVSIPNDSIGRFANGLRQNDVVTGADGSTIIDAITGINESGVLTIRAFATGGQFASAANVPAGTTFAAGVAASAVAVEIAAAPVEKALFITAYRSGGSVFVDGDSEGFERRDIVDIRVAKYNNKKKKWRKAQTLASVQIKKDESFSAVVTISGKVRVVAVSADGEVKSNRVQVAK